MEKKLFCDVCLEKVLLCAVGDVEKCEGQVEKGLVMSSTVSIQCTWRAFTGYILVALLLFRGLCCCARFLEV